MLAEFPRGALDKELSHTDMHQSMKQSQMMNEAESVFDVNKKNLMVFEEYKKGEEGIDYVKYAPGQDPSEINNKKLASEIKQKLKTLSIEEPELAGELSSRIFSTDSVLDKELAKGEIPIEEVKVYPGSIKGPEPEDDPTSYSKWFYDNQPKSTLVKGVVVPEAIGAKSKLLKMVQDGTALNEF